MLKILDQEMEALSALISEINPSRLFFLCDENTHNYCLTSVLSNTETSIPYEILEIEPGEEMKTLTTASQLWDILLEFGADRRALLVCVGGGVICDLGGFVASTYKRGIPCIYVPTTLLSMCDAAIGGKTGIDLHHIKNAIGTFQKPKAIFLYTEFLTTLPYIELRSGFAEMLKHGLVLDEAHFHELSSLEELTVEKLTPYIQSSALLKTAVVEKDFTESGERKLLNFGHTIGHAVESYLLEKARPIPHGEAVALGIVCESFISMEMGMLHHEQFEKITSTVQRFFPTIDLHEIDLSSLITLMYSDKKNVNGTLRFTLLHEIGTGRYDIEIKEKLVRKALNYYKYL